MSDDDFEDFTNEYSDNYGNKSSGLLVTQTDKFMTSSSRNSEEDLEVNSKRSSFSDTTDKQNSITPLSRNDSYYDSDKTNNNADDPNCINFGDPYVKKALIALGFTEVDLKYPEDTDIRMYTRNPALFEEVKQSLVNNVDKRIRMVKLEAERLRKETSSKSDVKKNKEYKIGRELNLDFEEIERERIRRAEIRDAKEVEQLILSTLINKFKVEKDMELEEIERKKKEEAFIEERKKIKQLRLDMLKKQKQEELDRKIAEKKQRLLLKEQYELEIQKKKEQDEQEKLKKKKLEEDEKRRQERYRQTQELIAKFEEERRKKILKQLMQQEEKEKVRQEHMKVIMEEKVKFAEEKQKKQEEILKNLKRKQAQEIRRLRRLAIEKEKRNNDIIENAEKERMKKSEERRQKNDEKVKRHEEFRKEKDAKREMENKILLEKEKIAEERANEIYERRIREIKERNIDNPINDRIQQNIERSNKYLEEKRKTIETKIREREERQKEHQAIINAKREKDAVFGRIDREQRAFSVLVADRKRQAIARQKEIELNQRLQRITQLTSLRQKNLDLMMKKKSEMSRERADMKAEFNNMIYSISQKGESKLKSLAAKFNLDYDSILQRAKDGPKRQSISEYFSEMNSNEQAANSKLSPSKQSPTRPQTVIPPSRPKITKPAVKRQLSLSDKNNSDDFGSDFSVGTTSGHTSRKDSDFGSEESKVGQSTSDQLGEHGIKSDNMLRQKSSAPNTESSNSDSTMLNGAEHSGRNMISHDDTKTSSVNNCANAKDETHEMGIDYQRSDTTNSPTKFKENGDEFPQKYGKNVKERGYNDMNDAHSNNDYVPSDKTDNNHNDNDGDPIIQKYKQYMESSNNDVIKDKSYQDADNNDGDPIIQKHKQYMDNNDNNNMTNDRSYHADDNDGDPIIQKYKQYMDDSNANSNNVNNDRSYQSDDNDEDPIIQKYKQHVESNNDVINNKSYQDANDTDPYVEKNKIYHNDEYEQIYNEREYDELLDSNNKEIDSEIDFLMRESVRSTNDDIDDSRKKKSNEFKYDNVVYNYDDLEREVDELMNAPSDYSEITEKESRSKSNAKKNVTSSDISLSDQTYGDKISTSLSDLLSDYDYDNNF